MEARPPPKKPWPLTLASLGGSGGGAVAPPRKSGTRGPPPLLETPWWRCPGFASAAWSFTRARARAVRHPAEVRSPARALAPSRWRCRRRSMAPGGSAPEAVRNKRPPLPPPAPQLPITQRVALSIYAMRVGTGSAGRARSGGLSSWRRRPSCPPQRTLTCCRNVEKVFRTVTT